MISNEPAARAVALRFLRERKIPFAPRSARRTYGWNGKTVATLESTTPRSAELLIHDGAHFLLCPTERRALPDFGLGQGPDSGKWSTPTQSHWDDEEELASMLGIVFMAALDLDFVAALYEHSWIDGDMIDNVAKGVKILAKLDSMRLLQGQSEQRGSRLVIEALAREGSVK